jgi:hypothetical protein
MLVTLSCKCGKRIEVPDSRVNTTGRCPGCRAPVRLVAPGFEPLIDLFDGILHIIDGPDRLGEVIIIGGPGPIEIGRHPEKHIVLGSPKVSRAHCRLSRLDPGWRVEDLKSTRGLSLNGERIEARDLRDGDELQIGNYELRYHWRGEGADSPPPTGEPLSLDLFEGLTSGQAVRRPAHATGDSGVNPEGSLLPGQLDGSDLYRIEGDPSPLNCPSCGKTLPLGARICLPCNIDVKTGRPAVTPRERP